MKRLFALPLLLLLSFLAAGAEKEKQHRLRIPGEFEFRIGGDWKIDPGQQADLKFAIYKQGRGEIAKEERALIWASMQVIDPAGLRIRSGATSTRSGWSGSWWDRW